MDRQRDGQQKTQTFISFAAKLLDRNHMSNWKRKTSGSKMITQGDLVFFFLLKSDSFYNHNL